MKTNLFVAMLVLILVGLMPGFAQAQVGDAALSYCEDLAFSTEEDFVTQGPEPPDGSPIISDGDLLGTGCAVCARSADLLGKLDVMLDLGLDAVDIIDVEAYLVAFSTELGYTSPLFTAGDLLVTNGAIIPNVALLNQTGVNPNLDLGLDAVHFKGSKTQIMAFLAWASTEKSRSDWVQTPALLSGMLVEFTIDIWFSTEGTAPTPTNPAFLDGDLLSARYGTIVQHNSDLLPSSVPAGVPSRGVDFGLDAVAAARDGARIRFSTEILYSGAQISFTDGDVLEFGNGVVEYTNSDLVLSCEPTAGFLGLDALYKDQEQQGLVPWLLNLLLDDD